MPISVTCDDCQKKYNVKDDMAGKKFRCKECQAIVAVPQADTDDDPFAGVDLRSKGKAVRRRDDDDDEEEDEDYDDYDDAPRRRKTSKPVKAKKSRRRGESMPASAIIATVCQLILLAFGILGAISTLANPPDRGRPQNANPAAYQVGRLTGAFIRPLIGIIVFVGMLQRSNNARRWSRALSTVGIIFGIVFVVILIGLSSGAQVPEAARAGMMIGILGYMIHVLLWIGLVVSLATDSAKEWYNR